MKYGLLLLNEDINSSQLQILGNKRFSITVNSECQLNKNDKVLGYLINSSKKIVLEYLVAENSTSTKLSLSKICEIAEGVTIEDAELLSVINKAKSLNQNLIELNEKDFANYEQKLFSLIGIGKTKTNTSTKPLPFPHNRIIFGAPGTGKSFKLKEDQEKYFDESHFERATFHPNYSYAQFVGTYKPTMRHKNLCSLDSDKKEIVDILIDNGKTAQEKYDLLFDKFKEGNSTRLPLLLGVYTDEEFKTRNVNGSDPKKDNHPNRDNGMAIRPYVRLYSETSDSNEITYEYVPGPFIRVLEKALKNPNENYLLLIEEINRANVAAVFGDAFQLLDRNPYNESEYKIATSEDLRKYLIFAGISEDKATSLYIPNNMYIWATMNSADQGVQPLDTAFKRRWDFEYLPINGDEKATVDNKPLEDYLNEVSIPIPPMAENKYKLESWNKIRKAINKKLKSIGINEDKLLGPFFISKSRLDEVNKIKDTPQNEGNVLFIAHFKSKVLMYLFEDAAKMHHSSIFDETNGKKHFSDICSDFDKKGIEIFSSDIVNEIRNASKSSQGE